jgi:hypothetical protein
MAFWLHFSAAIPSKFWPRSDFEFFNKIGRKRTAILNCCSSPPIIFTYRRYKPGGSRNPIAVDCTGPGTLPKNASMRSAASGNAHRHPDTSHDFVRVLGEHFPSAGPLNTAVDEVQCHVHDQPNTNQTGRRQDCQNPIHRDSRRGVKWMESNAAAVGIVDRVGEQMIEVYEHRD